MENEVLNTEEQMKSSFNAEIGTVGGNTINPSNKLDEIYEMIKEDHDMLKSIKENMDKVNTEVVEETPALDQTEVINTVPVNTAENDDVVEEQVDTISTVTPEVNEILDAVNSDTNTFSPVNIDSFPMTENESVEKIDSIEPVLSDAPVEEIKQIEEQTEIEPVKETSTENILTMDDLLARENKVEETPVEEEKITPIPLEEPVIPIENITPVEPSPIVDTPVVQEAKMPEVIANVNTANEAPVQAPVESIQPVAVQPAPSMVEQVVESPVEAVKQPIVSETKKVTDVTKLYPFISEVSTGVDQKQRTFSVVSNEVLKNSIGQDKTLGLAA